MTEITSTEAVRARLRAFEAKVADALTAAEGLARARALADAIAGSMDETSRETATQLEAARRTVAEARDALAAAQLAASEVQTRSDELTAALDSAVNRLSAEVAGQLELQRDKLESLAKETSASAMDAAASSGEARQRASEVREVARLLPSQIRTDVQAFTRARDEELRRDQADLRRDVDSIVSKLQTDTESQLATFLSKQNALVQNLTQVVEGFRGVADLQGNEIADLKRRLVDSEAERSKVVAKLEGEVRDLAKGNADLLRRTQEGQTRLADLDRALQDVVGRLKQLPFVGGKFQGL